MEALECDIEGSVFGWTLYLNLNRFNCFRISGHLTLEKRLRMNRLNEFGKNISGANRVGKLHTVSTKIKPGEVILYPRNFKETCVPLKEIYRLLNIKWNRSIASMPKKWMTRLQRGRERLLNRKPGKFAIQMLVAFFTLMTETLYKAPIGCEGFRYAPFSPDFFIPIQAASRKSRWPGSLIDSIHLGCKMDCRNRISISDGRIVSKDRFRRSALNDFRCSRWETRSVLAWRRRRTRRRAFSNFSNSLQLSSDLGFNRVFDEANIGPG